MNSIKIKNVAYVSSISYLLSINIAYSQENNSKPKSWSEVKPDKLASESSFDTNTILSIVGIIVLLVLLVFLLVRNKSTIKTKENKKEKATESVKLVKEASSSTSGIDKLVNSINNIFIKKKKSSPIVGIDITNESIVISQIRKTKTGLELEKLAIANTPQNAIRDGEIIDTGSIAQTIQDLLEKNNITAKQAITAVSGQAIIIRTIQFPAMSDKELKEVVLHEAERYIPFPIDDVNIDFQALREIEDEGITKVEVLLVAAQKQFINSYIETFIISGLKLVNIDIASFSIARSLTDPSSSLPFGYETPIVLVVIRGESSDLNIFENGIPKFSRSIPIGSTTFIETIATNLNLNLEEAIQIFDKVVIPIAGQSVSDDPLVETASNEIRISLRELTTEIQRSLEYYQSQENKTVQQLILSGRGAKIKNLDKHLSMNLGVDVETSNPISFIKFNEENFSTDFLVENSSIISTSIGLARKGVEEF